MPGIPPPIALQSDQAEGSAPVAESPPLSGLFCAYVMAESDLFEQKSLPGGAKRSGVVGRPHELEGAI